MQLGVSQPEDQYLEVPKFIKDPPVLFSRRKRVPGGKAGPASPELKPQYLMAR